MQSTVYRVISIVSFFCCAIITLAYNMQNINSANLAMAQQGIIWNVFCSALMMDIVFLAFF